MDDLFGRAFVIIPRNVLGWYFSAEREKVNAAKVILGLIFFSYHTAGVKTYKRWTAPCGRGEYIGNYGQFSGKVRLSRYEVKKNIDFLVQNKWVTLNPLADGFRLRFIEYLDFLARCDNNHGKKNTVKKNGKAAGSQPTPQQHPGKLSFPSAENINIINQIEELKKKNTNGRGRRNS